MKKISAIIVGLLLTGALCAGARAQVAATEPSESYTKVARTFLDGPWEDLEGQLAKMPKSGAGLSTSEKADLTYIFQAWQESRPAWWKQCKSGKASFKVPMWGRVMAVNYDPLAKQSLQFQVGGGSSNVTVAWPPGDMDNYEEAEHGFTKGELSALGVWQTLGAADFYINVVPATSLLGLNPAQKMLLDRFMDLRQSLTGICYSPPRSRRWGLWLACAANMDQYSKTPTVMARKSIAAMFVAEVIGHHDKYPSIELPNEFPAEKPEEKLAIHLKDWVEKHSWTVAEDKTLRDALRAFAVANEKGPRETGKVTLTNGMVVSLDPSQDAPNLAKREAWLKTQWEKMPKAAK